MLSTECFSYPDWMFQFLIECFSSWLNVSVPELPWLNASVPDWMFQFLNYPDWMFQFLTKCFSSWMTLTECFSSSVNVSVADWMFKMLTDWQVMTGADTYLCEEGADEAGGTHALQVHGVVVEDLQYLVARSQDVTPLRGALHVLDGDELHRLPRVNHLLHTLQQQHMTWLTHYQRGGLPTTTTYDSPTTKGGRAPYNNNIWLTHYQGGRGTHPTTTTSKVGSFLPPPSPSKIFEGKLQKKSNCLNSKCNFSITGS